MNRYTTMGRTRIRRRDVLTIIGTDGYLAADAFAALEQQRAAHAAAELERLLKQHNVTPPAAYAVVSRLRHRFAAALIRAGAGLVGKPIPDTAAP
jgi:hypothetical protein